LSSDSLYERFAGRAVVLSARRKGRRMLTMALCAEPGPGHLTAVLKDFLRD
jgi:hypothetical protein